MLRVVIRKMLPAGLAAVLSAFPAAAAGGPWHEVPAGFSGSRLWRSGGGWRLKAWRDVSAEHLRLTHAWMTALAPFDFVPRVCPTRGGDTIVADGPWAWDLVTWLPGEPLVESPARLETAAAALASVHRAWSTLAPAAGPSPAVLRRREILQRFPPGGAASRFNDLSSRLAPFVRPAIEALAPWARRPVRLQPCLCDIWTANILVTGERVTGLIDFGAAKIDNPAVDLARFRGSVTDPAPFDDAYRRAYPESPADAALAGALERSSDVVALATWVERLSGREPTQAEQARIDSLLGRLTST